jgi:alkanesulfonate monooxygenase SsuD/methylene tetrahydromethanopterin reductase-like flavin-dependent oxidoreductase (luciferase family)
MKLGLLVESEEGLNWERWLTTCVAAEALGFESVWITDHLLSAWSEERHGLEPYVALSVAAAQTQHIRLGPLVSPITFREPALVARMAEAIDALAPDRFVLGLGLGWNAHEHAQFGVPFPPVKVRVRMLADGIEQIRLVLGERRIPVLIGGGGPRSTLPLVARYADEWNLTTATVDVYQAGRERIAHLCCQMGRDPKSIRHSVAAGILIGRDASDLRERSARMQHVVPPLAGNDVADIPQASRRLGWLAGTTSEVAVALRSLADAGVERAILGHYDLTDVAALELIASEVMPALA